MRSALDTAPLGRMTMSPGPPTRVEFVGEFDCSSVDDLRDVFSSIPPGDVLLDLRAVEFCSSSFLSCLLALQQRVSNRGDQLTTAGMSSIVARLLDITGTGSLFPIIEEASGTT